MSRPIDKPDWATSSTFSSGPIIGQPNKATPSAGMIAEGWDPTNVVAAEHLNYELNNHGKWVNHADENQFGSWFYDREEFKSSPAWWSGGSTTTDTNAYGVQQITQTVATGTPVVLTGPVNLSSSDFRIFARLRIVALGTGGAFFFGFGNGSGVPGNAAVGFMAVQGTTANWVATTTVGGGVGTSSAAVDTNYHTFELYNVSGTLYYAADGSEFVSIATPAGTPALMAWVLDASGTVTMNVDMVAIGYSR